MIIDTKNIHDLYELLRKYSKDIDLNELINILSDNNLLYRYAWMGDKLIDYVLALNSNEFFGRALTSDDLHDKKLYFCSNNYFESQLSKLNVFNYIPFYNKKFNESLFEALIYIIYKTGREEAVISFLKEIDFFNTDDIHQQILKIDDTCIEFLNQTINQIKLKLEEVTYENSKNTYYEIYVIFKETINKVFILYIDKDIVKYEFGEVFEIIAGQLGLSNNLKYKVIHKIMYIGELINELNNGLNKNEDRIDLFIKPEKINKYVNKYIIDVLESLKKLKEC